VRASTSTSKSLRSLLVGLVIGHLFWKPRRKVVKELYLSSARPDQKLLQATQISQELEEWLENVPDDIRPGLMTSADTIYYVGIHQGPYWPKMQRFLIKCRHLHVKIMLFYPFFIHKEQLISQQLVPAEQICSAAEECKSAARELIRNLYWTYYHYPIYRTWGHNIIYVSLVVLVFLSDLAREPFEKRKTSENTELIKQAIEVLQTLEDCTVTQKLIPFVEKFSDSILSNSMSEPLRPDSNWMDTLDFSFSDFTAWLPKQMADY